MYTDLLEFHGDIINLITYAGMTERTTILRIIYVKDTNHPRFQGGKKLSRRTGKIIPRIHFSRF